MLSAEIRAPALLNDATTVPPYLITSLPLSSIMVKLVVVRLVTEPLSVMLPEDVTVPESVRPLAVPVPATEETEPPPVPAPMAVRKAEADKADTVLSALNCGNVTALGLVIVNRLPPSVVAPKLVRAVAAVVAPEPPLATGSVPVTLVAKFTKVVDVVPVPPEAMGRAVPSVREFSQLSWVPTSVPLLYTMVRVPAGTATPVWPETFTVTV